MNTTFFAAPRAALAAAMLLAAASLPALADGSRQYPLNANYKDECGACHVAFPPQLLSRGAWQELMAGLARHFGSDASLDAKKAAEIAGYLAANAGRDDKFAPATKLAADRLYVSRTRWFAREHRDGHDGLAAAVWSLPAVKSPANCGACHRGAENGDYSERSIRIPTQAKGVQQ
jgi:hypothetical protein